MHDYLLAMTMARRGDPRDDIFAAKSGFGGAEYLLPGLVSEGRKRGLSLRRIAELTSSNPASRYGLPGKGRLVEGADADIAIVDPDAVWTVRAEDSETAYLTGRAIDFIDAQGDTPWNWNVGVVAPPLPPGVTQCR